MLSVLYDEKVTLRRNFTATVNNKITEDSFSKVNKVVSLSTLAAEIVANTILTESFEEQKNILSSIGSMEIQRIVFNQLIIASWKHHDFCLSVFYLDHNEYHIAHHWGYYFQNSSMPPAYLMLGASLGPAFITYPPNGCWETAKCMLKAYIYLIVKGLFDNGYKLNAVCCAANHFKKDEVVSSPEIVNWILQNCKTILLFIAKIFLVNRDDFSCEAYEHLIDQLEIGIQHLEKMEDSYSVITEYITKEPVVSPHYFVPLLAKQYIYL